MAIDRLHADLPIDVMGKMEIYTFGSAASHLSNPCLTLNSPMNPNPSFTRADGSLVSPVKATMAIKGQRIEDTERVIPVRPFLMPTLLEPADIFAIAHRTLRNVFRLLRPLRNNASYTLCARQYHVRPRVHHKFHVTQQDHISDTPHALWLYDGPLYGHALPHPQVWNVCAG